MLIVAVLMLLLMIVPMQMASDIQWHFIGHLQSNKCNQLLLQVECI